ncbi:MAG TPA: acetylxylan esterase, partial [Pirellulales bacterium]|nr:acetylxylan esterase [Pirellulales bacterium]
MGEQTFAAEPAIYDEAQVPTYTLPDPLVMADGRPVTSAGMWRDDRRPEVLRIFEEQVYGKSPPAPKELAFNVIEVDSNALGGIATRKQIELVIWQGSRAVRVNVLAYLPNARQKPAPVFVGLNFGGNQTVHNDPAILVTSAWVRSFKKDDSGVVDNRATEASRGAQASRWPIEMIVKRGYALVTAYYGEIDPDFDDGFANGVHALYADQPRQADSWGAIAAWAWGLSRIADFLEFDRAFDAKRIAVIGHSRLGKAALWAGATDPRFAMVVSNNSGCGGAALSKRRFGESVAIINKSFPHWFCQNFRAYDDHEDQLPVDQHELLAL